jgi:transcription elongation factor Elf1
LFIRFLTEKPEFNKNKGMVKEMLEAYASLHTKEAKVELVTEICKVCAISGTKIAFDRFEEISDDVEVYNAWIKLMMSRREYDEVLKSEPYLSKFHTEDKACDKVGKKLVECRKIRDAIRERENRKYLAHMTVAKKNMELIDRANSLMESDSGEAMNALSKAWSNLTEGIEDDERCYIRNLIAECYVKQGDVSQARVWVQTNLEMHPNDALSNIMYMSTNMEMGMGLFKEDCRKTEELIQNCERNKKNDMTAEYLRTKLIEVRNDYMNAMTSEDRRVFGKDEKIFESIPPFEMQNFINSKEDESVGIQTQEGEESDVAREVQNQRT